MPEIGATKMSTRTLLKVKELKSYYLYKINTGRINPFKVDQILSKFDWVTPTYADYITPSHNNVAHLIGICF